MPKVRLTADDRRNEFFSKKRKIAKAQFDRPNYECAADLKICQHTLSYKLKNAVDNMSLKEFIYFVHMDMWSDDEIIQFVRGK